MNQKNQIGSIVIADNKIGNYHRINMEIGEYIIWADNSLGGEAYCSVYGSFSKWIKNEALYTIREPEGHPIDGMLEKALQFIISKLDEESTSLIEFIEQHIREYAPEK